MNTNSADIRERAINKALGLKISLHVNNECFQKIQPFIEKVLVPKHNYTEPGIEAFKLSNNDLLLIHGPGAYSGDFIFKNNNQIVCFEVHDLRDTIKIAKDAGFKLVSNIITEQYQFSFAYIELEDKLMIGVYEMHQHDI